MGGHPLTAQATTKKGEEKTREIPVNSPVIQDRSGILGMKRDEFYIMGLSNESIYNRGNARCGEPQIAS